MRWRVLVGFLCFVVALGVVGLGVWGVDRYVIRPAEHAASGTVANAPLKEISGPSITFVTTTVPAASATTSPPTTAVNARLVAAGAALAHAATNQRTDVVPVGSGFVGASWDQDGHIEFWTWTAGNWSVAAARNYPAEGPSGYGTAGVTVTGRLLAGMTTPVFLVAGHFESGDTANALAFGEGTAGWGVLVPTGNQLVSSGGSLTYSGPGLEWSERFDGNRFETVQRPTEWETTFDALYPVTSLWAGHGATMTLAHSDVVTAHAASTPPPATAALPTTQLRPDGVYAGRVEAATAIGTSPFPDIDLQVEPGTLTPCSGTELCFQPGTSAPVPVVVGSNVPTDYLVGTATGSAWVTGPAWGLAAPGGIVPSTLETLGASPWYLPASLGVTYLPGGTTPIVGLRYQNGSITAIYEPLATSVG